MQIFTSNSTRLLSKAGLISASLPVRRLATRQANMVHDALANSDPEQVRLMEERVILVDPKDHVLGDMSKKDAHLVSNNLPLHRAFSIFLFDSRGRMLMQQRAPTKVTFPSYWTNTVCSHPLYTPFELGSDASDPTLGVKRAALRKLEHELGVKKHSVHPDELQFMSRIHYRAECKDGIWGEHEIDYVFMVQKDVELAPQSNEVCGVRYVDIPELKSMFDKARASDLELTPWFCHIMNAFGWKWWHLLLQEGAGALKSAQDVDIVHAVGFDTSIEKPQL